MKSERVILAAIVAGAFAIVAAVISPYVADRLEADREARKASSSVSGPLTANRDDDATSSEPHSGSELAAASDRPAITPSKANPPPVEVISERRDRRQEAASSQTSYLLDRTEIQFRLYLPDQPEPPVMYIGFRNGSSQSLQYRFNSVFLTMNGVAIRLSPSSSGWINLAPTEDLGIVFTLTRAGVVLEIGSHIDVTYEIDIRAQAGAPIERRYETVRKIVISYPPLAMREQLLTSRSVIIR